MPVFVLDASVTLAWFMSDELCERALFDEFSQKGALVPSIWHLEVSNALLSAQRKGRLSRDKRRDILHLLAEFPITVDPMTSQQAWWTTIDLAELYDLTLYDACYLELALRRSLPLLTLDRALYKAAVTAQCAYII